MNDRIDCDEDRAKESPDNVLSLGDFFDPTKPWDLRDRLPDDKVRKAFSFVPERFIEGSWKPIASWTFSFIVASVLYLTVDANIKFYASENNSGGIMKEFVGDDPYPAFTMTWYYNAVLFCWMTYVCRAMYIDSKRTFGGWVTFTIWSWTIMCIRHGLCTLAPFFPSARLLAGILRFPVLLSASVTFEIWNFILMPVITLVFISGKRRSNFLRFAFKWTLCQIHIFNIFYAFLNCVWAEPNARPFHLGDYNAGVIYMMTYIFFYFFFLDRLGIQLYPIFSPRTYICIPSWAVAAGVIVGNSIAWNKVLSAYK